MQADIEITKIKVASRKRSLDNGKVAELAHSISQLGLLNPVTVKAVNSHYELIAGYHRLEAFKLLKIKSIPAQLFEGDNLSAELAEIDENLKRNDLTVLEQGEHLKRRNEILEERGERAQIGDNQHNRGGEIVAPPQTTSDLASEIGMSERSAQQRVQIASGITEEAKELLRDTNIADSTTQLLEIARMDPDTQVAIAKLIDSGEAKDLKGAKSYIKLAAANERFKEQTREQASITPFVEVADCLKWIRKQKYCDLLLTDPPYSTDLDEPVAQFATWLPLALEKVKDTGRAYVFIGAYPEELGAYLNQKYPLHMCLEQVLIWEYKNTLGQNPKNLYKQNYQTCLYFVGTNAPALDCPMTKEQWAVIHANAPDGRLGDRFHSWQKPIEIAEMFIRHSTQPGALVYDPFACTGTFLLAAAKLGRVGKGCDISEENLKIAIERGCQYA